MARKRFQGRDQSSNAQSSKRRQKPSESKGGTRPQTSHAFASSITKRQILWFCLVLIAVNIVVYEPLRRYGFVNYDDPQYVTSNPNIAAGLTWQGVRWALTAGYSANWHPLTWMSHMLDIQLYGLSPGPHHVSSILLHGFNTLLLFLLLHRMTHAAMQSAFAAGLFAVHPLHVQSVAWIAERKDVLCGLFWMLALLAYVKYVEQRQPGWYLTVLILLALGLAAKPMMITFPFVLLLLDFWPLSRTTLSPSGERAPLRLVQLVWEKIPMFALTVASSVVTFVVQERGGATAVSDLVPLSARVANGIVSYVTYVVQMFIPKGLAVFYPFPLHLPAWETAGALLILVGVSTLVVLARRYPYLPVGWFWFIGTLVPVIGFVQVGSQARADRYTYIPLIGLFVIVAWGTADWLARMSRRKGAFPVVAAVVIGLCMIVSLRQVHFWRNSETLWRRALDVTSENYMAENNLAAALGDDRLSERVAHLSEAVRIKPRFSIAQKNLGIDLAKSGQPEEGVRHLSEAIRLNPGMSDAHNDLAVLLTQQGKLKEAIAHYGEAVRLNPNLAVFHNNFGYALAEQGKLDEAITHYSEALRLDPGLSQAHTNLGRAFAAKGKVDEAIQELSKALSINPNQPEVRQLLNQFRR